MNANQMAPGIILSIDKKLFCIETISKSLSAGKVTQVTAKLRDISTDVITERKFDPADSLKDVSLSERTLEFLYPDSKDFLFLDIETLEEVRIPSAIIGGRIEYMKAGVQIRASAYSEAIIAIELPQFLELMVANVEDQFVETSLSGNVPSKEATLETGATLRVPTFVEVGDVIKVDTRAEEYIQRI